MPICACLRSLPLTLAHSRSLPLTPAHFRSLPLTSAHFFSLPITPAHSRSLLRVLIHEYLRENNKSQECQKINDPKTNSCQISSPNFFSTSDSTVQPKSCVWSIPLLDLVTRVMRRTQTIRLIALALIADSDSWNITRIWGWKCSPSTAVIAWRCQWYFIRTDNTFFSWRYMTLNDYHRLFMITHGSPWIPITLSDSLWLSMTLPNPMWLFATLNVFPWCSMTLYCSLRLLRLSMPLCDFPWLSMNPFNLISIHSAQVIDRIRTMIYVTVG